MRDPGRGMRHGMTRGLNIAKCRARGDLYTDDHTLEPGCKCATVHGEDFLGHHPLAFQPTGARTPHRQMMSFFREPGQAVRNDKGRKPEIPDHGKVMGMVHL